MTRDEGLTMASELRDTGISVVGDIPWGTHLCHFYETKQDLLDTLVPYFKTGLESNEFCIWVVSDAGLITVEEAKEALAQAVPDLDRHLAAGNIEVLNGSDWYLDGGLFNLEKVVGAWDAKLNQALALGYEGMRVSGDTFWLRGKDWKDFCAYEKQLNDSVADRRMNAVCTYPLAKSGAAEVLNIVQAHQFAIARRQGEWEIIETPQLIQAKAEIRKLNEELEQRVVERTLELVAANEALISEIGQRRRVEEELRERAAELTEAQRVAKIGNWIFNLSTNKVTWSEELLRIFEIEELNFDGRYESFLSRIHPDDQSRVLRTNTQSRNEGSPFNIEYRIITPNDQVKIIREVGYAATDESGNVIRLFGTAQDITEHKRAEEALQQARSRIESVLNSVTDLHSLFDRDCRFLYANEAALRAFGRPREQILGRTVWEVFPDIIGTELERQYRRAMEERVRVAFEFHYPATNTWWENRFYPAPEGLSVFATDITVRKQAEEALAERLRFETLVTELSAAFANLSRDVVDREIDKWLQTLAEFLGVDRASFFQFGEDWTTLYRSHSYTVPGIEPLPPAPIGMKDQFPWITDQLRQGVTVKWSRIPDDMPEEATREKEYAARLGVKSGLNIPVRMGGSVICAITFTSIVAYRDWPDAMVARLRLVGEIFAAAVERKRAEALLHAKEQEFRAIVENAPDHIARYDRSFRRTYVNPAFAKALDLPAEALIGKPILSSLPAAGVEVKEDELEQIQRLQDVFDTGQSCEFEVTVPMPAGRRHFNVRFFPERDLNGSVINVLAIARDITERRTAEEELKKEKEILEKIFDNIPVMVGFVGEDGSVKLVNPEWERTIGWTLKELQEQNVDIFVEAYPDLRYRQEVLDFVAASTGEWVDLKIKVRDGRVIDAACSVVHLSDGTKVAIAQDITERKQAEDVLRRSEDHLRLVLDTTPALIHTGRPDGYLDYFNQRWLKYVGRSLEELQGWGWTASIHPDDVEGIVNEWRASLASGEPFQYEARIQQADGEYRWMLHRKVPLRDEHGNIVKWHGSSIDIEIRKQAEEKLLQSERQLSEAQRQAHVGSFDWDLRSDTVTWSDELYRIFGLEPGKTKITGDALAFIHPEDRDLVLSNVRTAVENKEPYSFYYRVLRPGGEERIVHSRGQIVSDEDGEPIKVFGVTQDVTELKRAEEKLKATSEQLRALSASLESAREMEATRIARELHDEMGGTLSLLRWNLEDLVEVMSESADPSQLIELRKRIDVMIELTDITVHSVRRIVSELRPFALDELGLSDAIEWHARQFQTRTGIICRYECSLENIALTRAQSTAVFRIIQEALTNILRHAAATEIDIRMTEENREFVLTIRDNGRGITDEEKSGSRSLGLLGMRERAHLARGKVEITGQQGKGTLVTVRIPVPRER